MVFRGVQIMVLVTKADGSKQLFDREKVVRTCLRMGASRDVAEEVAGKVEMRVYDGIATEKILQMIFRLLRKYKPRIRHLIDLRKALASMASKPDFELFVQSVLGENGFEVSPNRNVRGRCVEHEVDAIARKNGVTYFVEVKHHSNFHVPTGLDESRIARAVLEDVTEGYELGLNDLKVDRAMIVTNTKFSNHAKQYAECRGIVQVGWSSPLEGSLQDMIEAKKLYPVTCLKGLKANMRNRLSSAGIVFLEELAEGNLAELKQSTGLSTRSLELVIEKAKECTMRNAAD
ncbi:MAG: restriction endonuclease [Candidatus Bathyarchaeota archaeon]|nr:restriction endonuclease [Candidatus Bathyarchaeota archaeon]